MHNYNAQIQRQQLGVFIRGNEINKSLPVSNFTLQITNTRIPKAGTGASFGSMLEDAGRTSSVIQFTSGGSDQRNIASGGGFNYDSNSF